ncbi:hypothetical protein K435DRAFT_589585, partial [Dendrothele bispora CBS 962.96]
KPCTDDPIQFWTSKLNKPGDKPTPKGALAQMGLDFCSAPAALTDVERLFSHAGLLVTKCRHNMKFSTLRAAMVLKSWFESGLVPEEEVIKFYREL